jgi:hypothetical protein
VYVSETSLPPTSNSPPKIVNQKEYGILEQIEETNAIIKNLQ